MDIEKVIRHLKENIISVLFSIIGSEIILYSVQREFSFIYSAIVLILVIAIYILFERVVELDKKGPILYLGVAAVVFILSFFIIQIGSSAGTGFYRWFIGGGNTLEKISVYEIVSVLIIPFIFTSLSYYFSVTVSRMTMMFLIAFIALTLNIKGVYRVNRWYIFVFIILLFMLFIVSTRNEDIRKESVIKIDGKYIVYIGSIFISIILVISLIISKPDKLPVIGGLEEFKGYVQGFVKNSESESGAVDGEETRDIDSPMNPNSNKILYTFKGDNPEYLVDKNFDVYEKNKWVQDNKKMKNEEVDINNYIDLEIRKTIEMIESSSNLKGELLNFKSAGKYGVFGNYINIKIGDISTREFMHPYKTTQFDYLNTTNTKVYLNNFDEVYLDRRVYFKSNQDYKVKYISDNPYKNSKEYIVMKYFNEDRYMEFIKDNFNDEIVKKENNNLQNIKNSYIKIGNNVTNRTKDLAVDITKDAQSNYDKVKIIEEYFTKGNFKYNLDLPKQKGNGDYIDYFIFEGKEGYCVQYATAMTLMCRAAGIPARYVEGALITDKDYNNIINEYEVKESNGHAFVEAYIPGYGWKRFDPTPSTTEDKVVVQENQINNEESTKSGINLKKIATVVLIVLLILVSAGVGVIIYTVTESSRYFKKISKMNNEEAFEEIMRNTIILLERCDLKPYLRDTELTFSVRVDKRFNIGFSKLMERYYEYKYGNKNIEDEVLARAIKINKSIYEYINK